MIIVTIIIAAVVSAFSGGMSTSVKSAPVTSFEFKIYQKYVQASYGTSQTSGIAYITATLKNGETLNTQDLKIISSHRDANGNLVYYTFDPASNTSQQTKGNGGTSSTPVGFRSFSGPGTYKNFGMPGVYWHEGDLFSGLSCLVLGLGPQPSNIAYCNPSNPTSYAPKVGDVFDIEVVDKPTNTVIYQTEVTVI